ncbi:hypothetical protein [Levilactobacillus brevis]|uniref:hypothetical protein n=1 Tax=Levilactobacillus brevis TaxID=1580 RepID=UPI002936C08D|nr:hypothetical protein [Levilactobacillus brevis]MDV2566191.1 hypothetical protein [Levilactobacillus brevis]MDV2585005.1 hypothetical protein [Levilactobacillus brevis]
MADTSELSLVAFKGNSQVAKGDKGKNKVEITGLQPGAVISDGEYKVAYTDGANVSDKTDVPGFSVLSVATVGSAIVGKTKI